MKKLFLLTISVILLMGVVSAQPSSVVTAKKIGATMPVKQVNWDKAAQRFNRIPSAVKKAVMKETFQKGDETSKNLALRDFMKAKRPANFANLVYSGAVQAGNPEKATIVLKTEDMWDNHSGYVMFIGEGVSIDNDYDENFDEAAYIIPSNATANQNTTPMVVGDSVAIEIAEGTYSYFITNPKRIISVGGAYEVRNITFRKGWTYFYDVYGREVRNPITGKTSIVDQIRFAITPAPNYAYSLPFTDNFEYFHYPYQWNATEWKDDDRAMIITLDEDVDNALMPNAPIAFPAGDNYLHFVGLSLWASPCTIEVYMGKTNKREQMNKVGEVGISADEWRPFTIPFQITQAGNYYVSIEAKYEDEFASILLSKILINSGIYVPTPDLSIPYILPPLSGCSQSNELINFVLYNNGDGVANNYTITYSIDGKEEQQTFNQPIAPQEAILATTTKTFDFSELKTYEISATVEVANDANPDDNSAFTEFYTSAPHETPIDNLLLTEEEISFFHSFLPGAWQYDYYYIDDEHGFGVYEAFTNEIPLYTDCIQLKPGIYNFSFAYTAGYFSGTSDVTVFMGKSGASIGEWKAIAVLTDINNFDPLTYEISLSVKEADNYRFAFISDFGNVGVGRFELSQAPGHDVAVKSFSGEAIALAAIPQKQLVGVDYSYTIEVKNRGANNETFKVELLQDESVIASKNVTLAVGATNKLSLTGKLKYGQENAPFVIQAKATLATDENLANNTQTCSILKGNTFATENMIEGEAIDGIGDRDRSRAMFGNIYTLKTEDQLKSITALFYNDPEVETYEGIEFGLAIYNIDLFNSDPEEGYYRLGAKVHEKLTYQRPAEGGFMTWELETPLALTPGTYFLGAIQLKDCENILVALDYSPTGCFYVHEKADTLSRVDRINSPVVYGNIALRANFVDYVPTGLDKVKNTDILAYWNKNLLSVNAGQTIRQIVVNDIKGSTVYQTASGLNVNSYKVNTAEWAKGVYIARIATAQETKAVKFIVR